MRDDIVSFSRTVSVVEKINYADIEVRLFGSGDHRLADLQEEIAEAACVFFGRHK
jgi:hypothetical protein